jgi:hypothetical protein
MDQDQIQLCLEDALDDLAAIEHERWAHWQRYLHDQAERRNDGALILPADLVTRWEAQIARTFAQLSESEKDSDREQVRRYLPRIVQALNGVG